ncbi:hypothetical protein [Nocardia otitidiscaviarum]|uniref:hypothetical protein n=1 Tax=Nocardia otitidiscaviarum TaxID=1823 RepID=UPI001895BF4E|nr:hypothetical protein [Nocardia otitidiscaviarum]MBF6177781.1 hypothetical protein [Nocardia otitidiscaviarum]
MTYFEVNGEQVVQIDVGGKVLSWLWAGDPPLQLGERVILPPTLFREEEFDGVVVALGSDYDQPGKLRHVSRRA